MIEDIKIPDRTPNHSNRPTMRSQRLLGHSALSAKTRIRDNEPTPAASLNLPIYPEEPVEPEPHPLKKGWTKKRKIILIIGVVFLIISGSSAGWFLYFNKSEPPPPTVTKKVVAKKTEPPKPTTLASPLTGVQVPPDLAKRSVTTIMIENSPDARPQSGLRDAGIIFEAIAEGGITRFATLFQESQPAYIGPIRSLRPYYIDWFSPFDSAVAHVGGSRDALDIIRSPGYKDLDQFFNSGSYQRISERYAPHNVYTSFENLNALNTAKGYTTSTFTPWKRKADKKLAVPTAKTIDLNVSGFYYNVHYDYDPASNTYLRSQAGKAHVDVTSQKDPAPRQLNPKVVIALIMPFSTVRASDGWRVSYGTIGSGPMLVFQDGSVTAGTWSKPNSKTQMVFKDSAGAEIPLNTGQTWVTALDAGTDAVFKP